MYHVKLQIRINSNIYDAMKNLGRVKKWEQKEAYERALKHFLEHNHFIYHPVLKQYVLDIPSVKSVTKTINLIKENENGKLQQKAQSKKRPSINKDKPTTARKQRQKETYIIED